MLISQNTGNFTYDEARRDFESAGNVARFDSVDSDTAKGVILVEARIEMGSVRREGELGYAVGLFLG